MKGAPTLPTSGLVRINPRSTRGAAPHWGRGRMIQLGKRHSLVQPMGHGKPERIDNAMLKPWKAKA